MSSTRDRNKGPWVIKRETASGRMYYTPDGLWSFIRRNAAEYPSLLMASRLCSLLHEESPLQWSVTVADARELEVVRCSQL